MVRTDKGKEFINSRFRKLLDAEIRVCKNPAVKCAIVERFNRRMKYKPHKCFTLNNT